MEGAAIWPVAEHRHQGSGGSAEVDGWNTFSPGQSSRQHSQSENWMSDEGCLGVGDMNTCSPHSNSSPSPSNVGWHVGTDPAHNVQHELEPIGDDELNKEEGVAEQREKTLTASHEDASRARGSGWEGLKHLPPTDSDSQSPLEPCPGSGSSGDKTTSCSPDLEDPGTPDGGQNTPNSGGFSSDPPMRQQEEFVVPQSLDLPSGGTPDGTTISSSSGGGGVGGGGGGGGGVAGVVGGGLGKSRASVGGSTSSINSIGSSSSWKSEGKNGYHSKPSGYSPHKTTR